MFANATPEGLAALVATTSTLTTIYWACAVLGVGILLFSSLSGAQGGGDGAADVDPGGVDADVGHTGDASGADFHHGGGLSTLSTWLSLRFVFFFVAVFGSLGVILSNLSELEERWTLGIALVGGVVVGQTVHQVFRRLRRSEGNSAPEAEDYLNQVGQVTVAIRPPQQGEVAIDVRGGQRFVPAMSRHADIGFTVGDEVVVLGYRHGVAEVVSHKEAQFLSSTKEGESS